MEQIAFEEKQRFDTLIIYVMTAFCLVMAVILSYNGASYDQLKVLLIPFMIAVGIWFFVRMTTSINEEGIYVQVKPFHLKPQLFKWKDIKSIEVVNYSPLLDYGGYGIRHTFSKGKAYNMAGKIGIKINHEGKDILIGTQKEEEMTPLLRRSAQKHKIKFKHNLSAA